MGATAATLKAARNENDALRLRVADLQSALDVALGTTARLEHEQKRRDADDDAVWAALGAPPVRGLVSLAEVAASRMQSIRDLRAELALLEANAERVHLLATEIAALAAKGGA